MLEQINHDIRHIDRHNVLNIIETYGAYGIPTRKEIEMTIRTEIREIEKHIKTIAETKDEQIAILSKAQSLTIDNERNLAILAVIKNRIIRAS